MSTGIMLRFHQPGDAKFCFQIIHTCLPKNRRSQTMWTLTTLRLSIKSETRMRRERTGMIIMPHARFSMPYVEYEKPFFLHAATILTRLDF